ncbi:hypothetical protein BST86_12285 [Nonlabens agnitus]|uniref:Peptidase C39-like domain-containing protein n=1 Tax=Nonlabens agnitus TaxID=870484 RepID=A0A2S9WWH3_9FLAO|nr:hypothetical protein BST86_12285 [Nonlabens agnitus]
MIVLSASLFGCEKDLVVEYDNCKHNASQSDVLQSHSINDLPILREKLSAIVNSSRTKDSGANTDVQFELFESFEIISVTLNEVTTYTLPIKQATNKKDQLSNLVLSYENDTLVKSHIFKYKGDLGFNDLENRKSGILFYGQLQIISVDQNIDLFAKTSSCYPIDILVCSWVDPDEGGGLYFAGANCTAAFISSMRFTFCPDGDKIIDISLNEGSGTTGGTTNGDGTEPGNFYHDGSPWVGNIGDPEHNYVTTPVPDPPCEQDPLSLTEGGCYDAQDNLEPIDDDPTNDIIIGSTNNTPGGDPYVPNDDDVFVLSDIPTTMSKQVGASCVSSSIEYVANVLGGETTRNEIDNWFLNTFKIMIPIQGVPFDKVSILVSHYLTTGPFIGIKEAIDAGNPYLTNIELSRTVDAEGNIFIDGHMVIIVGYHPNGDYIFMDPLAGSLREAPPSSFPNDFSYGGMITGVR